jgi:hypothetical protein
MLSTIASNVGKLEPSIPDVEDRPDYWVKWVDVPKESTNSCNFSLIREDESMEDTELIYTQSGGVVRLKTLAKESRLFSA